jgi:hypothetical protein
LSFRSEAQESALLLYARQAVLSFRSEAQESALLAASNADLSAALRDDKETELRDDNEAVALAQRRIAFTRQAVLSFRSEAKESALLLFARKAVLSFRSEAKESALLAFSRKAALVIPQRSAGICIACSVKCRSLRCAAR